MPFCSRPARLPLVTLAVLLGACAGESGPLHTNEEALRYEAPVAAGATAFVRTLRGSIEVTPSADSMLRVRARVTWRGNAGQPPELELSGAAVPEGVLICARTRTGTCTTTTFSTSTRGRRSGLSFRRRDRASDAQAHFTVEVPSGVRLDLLGIDARITAAATAPIRAKSLNGDVTVVTAVGPIQAETMNGSVDARMSSLAGTDSVIVKTMNGDAWLFLPESVSADVDVSTMNGTLDTDFPALRNTGSTPRKSVRATLGEGTTPVRVRTMNGTAGLRRLDAEGRSYQR
jgi:hypothetical protein